MTAYAAVSGSTPGSIGVLASTYQIRIAKIEFTGANSGSQWINVFRYSGAGLSGGTSVTPVALRQNGPSSTASAKASATVSGTSAFLHTELIGAGSFGGYQFPFDLIVSPASALVVVASNTAGSATVGTGVNVLAVYYEELRLAWSV